MADFPNDRRYTKEHEWAKAEGGLVRVGITTHAVQQLGDITLVDLPATGTRLASMAHFGDIESVKAVSELFSPLAGEVIEVNSALENGPELVNESPYDRGWMVVIRPDDARQVDGLLDATSYARFVDGLDHP